MILETDRLLLRELGTADSAFILELVNDEDWLLHIGDRGVRTLQDASRFIEDGPMASYSEHGFGLWCAQLKDDLMPIGLCGVLKREHLDHPDLGYALLPDFRGKGYALEACRGVIEFAQTALDMHTMLAIVSPQNTRSIHLLERLGFEYAGVAPGPGASENVQLFRTTLTGIRT